MLSELGGKHGWEFEFSKDGSKLSKDYLTQFDAVFFYTTGNLLEEGTDKQPPMSAEGKQALFDFVKAGKGFIGTHSASERMYVMGSKSSNGQDRLLIYTLDTEVVDGITYNGTPANPVLIKFFSTTYVHEMFVKNNIGYASHIYDYKLRVWDLTNVNNITETAHYYYDSGKYNHSSWLHADGVTLVEATELPRGEPLSVLRKVSGNPSLQLVGTLKEPLEFPVASDSRPHNPHINGNYMYVSCYEDGVQVFDIS